MSKTDIYNKDVHDGGWIRSDTFSYFTFPTYELAGQTIGIIGYGSIGRKVAKIANCKAIITGENLGQVASQTVESMTVTNFSQTEYPIFRPLIAFDKKDIIAISRKIGTYDTSILPYEDCCTVFLPKNPVIKPKMEKVIYEESKLDIDNLVNNAIENLEMIDC